MKKYNLKTPKKDFMLRVRMNTTTLKQLHQLAEKRNADMSKIIRTLLEREYANEHI
jgi:antitoxin component of RelBE/YafQ-DinJ toxin-antitoxin module